MRNYRRKTRRGTISKEIIEKAVKEVLENKTSLREAAKIYNIPSHATLSRYVKKAKETGRISFDHVGYKTPTQVFSDEQASKLVDYIKFASKIYYGMTPIEVRKFAFQCAEKYNLKCPNSWHERKMAGEDWFSSFLKKHPTLSIRSQEATSLGRCINFNRENVSMFFDKLSQVLTKYKFDASRIWNVDETGVTTVQKLSRVVAEKGSKQVGGVTSSERGQLVTLCVAINAIGNSVPPMFIFPRKRYQDYFIRHGPPNSIGAGNGSGWMTCKEFAQFMEHFKKYVQPSAENPVLLLLDNHESHLDVEIIDFAKKNGIIMLSFPPHCSHQLQPLDKSVFGPFKKYLSSSQQAWHINNPGKAMSIYDIPNLVANALSKALTQGNILSGFKATGIQPFNENIFSEDAYLPSFVTDQPVENTVEAVSDVINSSTTLDSSLKLNIEEIPVLILGAEVEIVAEEIQIEKEQQGDNPDEYITAKDDKLYEKGRRDNIFNFAKFLISICFRCKKC